MQIHGLTDAGAPSPGGPYHGRLRRQLHASARRRRRRRTRTPSCTTSRLIRCRSSASWRAPLACPTAGTPPPLSDLAQSVFRAHRHGGRLRQQFADPLPVHDADGVQPAGKRRAELADLFPRHPAIRDAGPSLGQRADQFPGFRQGLRRGRGGRELSPPTVSSSRAISRTHCAISSRTTSIRRTMWRTARRLSRPSTMRCEAGPPGSTRCWSSPMTSMAAATITSSRRPPRRRAADIGRLRFRLFRRAGAGGDRFALRAAGKHHPAARADAVRPYVHHCDPSRQLFGFSALTARDAAAPSLLGSLYARRPSNEGRPRSRPPRSRRRRHRWRGPPPSRPTICKRA